MASEDLSPFSYPPNFRWRAQSGVVVLLTLALLVLLVGMLVIGFGNDLLRQNETDQRTANTLSQAKEALIGFAANYPDAHPGEVFGYLPCPDLDGASGEGSTELNCGTTDVTAVGRLPWKTLGVPPLRDGDGECLWYAVSGNFKYNPKTDLMNWDTNGLLEIMAADGSNFVAGGSGTIADPTRRAAAVVFAPGKILPGQDRSLSGITPTASCGGNYTAANYLDPDATSGINNASAPSLTANALTRFVAAINSERTTATNNFFNDRLAFISPNDIFARRAELRSDFLPYLTDPTTGMLRRVADCIVKYGKSNSTASDKRLPWAAPTALPNYGLQSNYNDGVGIYSGRLPYTVDGSAQTSPLNALAPPPSTLLASPFCPGWSTTAAKFWSNWKDHVFYAVAQAFAPNSTVASDADPCGGGLECLTVDGTPKVAAVLIFAGIKQSGQSRNTNADYSSPDKSAPANYLEGVNLSSIQSNTPGSPPWPRQFSNSAGNDTVMCVMNDPGAGLVVDATCGAGTACTADGNSLASYGTLSANNCRQGKDGVIPACQTLANRINNNNCSCKASATIFISKGCVSKDWLAAKCQNAWNALLGPCN